MDNVIHNTEADLRKLLADKVASLTEEQRAGFVRIHSHAPWKSWEQMPGDKLLTSIDLCNRSLSPTSSNEVKEK